MRFVAIRSMNQQAALMRIRPLTAALRR